MEIGVQEEFAIVLMQKDGLTDNGGHHGAMKESAIPVNNMKNALENLMVKALVMEPGVGTEREIQDVRPHLVKILHDWL